MATASMNNGSVTDVALSIDKSECYAKNEHPNFPMTNLFVGDTRLGCKSDADEQLLLHVAFPEFVKVKSIKFTHFNLGLDPEFNPTTVKLFVNRESMGFEDCEDMDATQELELTHDDLRDEAEPIPLKYVLFQRVKSITVFVEDNNGGDVSALGALQFYGKTISTTNMADFKKTG
mmetsp:Transcript_6752/g.8808  ORF Transcript_6752/g.8808 Transcript_6752/m.8808 type:complete len:175 (-) Transcript_6752:459-983(-)